MTLRTLFLQAPSFDGFDGGAGSRYQAKREIKSFWFPTWLAQPAALVPNSRVLDAPADELTVEASLKIARDYDLVIMHTSTPSFPTDARFAEMLRQDNPNIKIGLVGCGGRGSGSIANALSVNPGARLYAMADAFPDRLDSARTQIQQKFSSQVDVNNRCFAGFDAAQKLVESGVQVALLTTTPHFRPMHIEACIEAGVHVFAEKPMAVDAPATA